MLRGGHRYKRVFRFWDGDETDASVVITPGGNLLVGRHMEENVPRPEAFPRDHEIGNLMELDPRRPAHPVVWSHQLGGYEKNAGLLGTPAYANGIVYATWSDGGVAAVEERTGRLLWKEILHGPTWSSPVPIDGKLLVADGKGYLDCFDVSRPHRRPPLVWRLQLSPSVIESTPAVWKGWIYVGSRDGGIYGVSDPRR